MLWVDGRQLRGDSPTAALEDLLNSHIATSGSHLFLEQLSDQVPGSSKQICVVQGECAYVELLPSSLWLGSEDATTCVIAVAMCKERNWAWVGHFDLPAVESEEAFSNVTLEDADLYLVGAYKESSGVSYAVMTSLVKHMHFRMQSKLTVRLACVLQHNTGPDGSPRSRQLAVDCMLGVPYPKTFADRGPELSRRNAARHVGNEEELHPVIDAYGNFLLPGVSYRLSALGQRSMAQVLRLSDRACLEQCSTSPEHEGPNFLTDLRACYAWLMANNKKVVPEAVYVWDFAACKWKRRPNHQS